MNINQYLKWFRAKLVSLLNKSLIVLSAGRLKILELPALYWMFGSFLIAYFLFFIEPVFLNPEQSMRFSPYLDAITPIGGDMRLYLSMGKVFVTQGKFNNIYPPLVTLLMSPFASMNPARLYKALVLFILFSYLFVTLIIPALLVRSKQSFFLLIALFLTGLFSYGLHFELERGQFNVIAFQFALVAIYLFHYKPKFRYLAYVLFSIGAQLKIYPAIYILMFIDDWRDWKANIKRFVAIGIFNLVLLFILGYKPVFTFLNGLKSIPTAYVWVGNHSIKSFTMLLQAGQFQAAFSNYHLLLWHDWAKDNSTQIGAILTALIFLCFITVTYISFVQNIKGFNVHLFVVSTLIALLLPAISHDYKLSILGSAVGIALGSYIDTEMKSKFRILHIFLISLITFSYSSVLFSYVNKPVLLQNNLPALMLILLCFTVMTLLSLPKREDVSL